MSIIDDAKAFFGLKKRKQRKEADQLKKIIVGLSAKAKGMKKRYEKDKSSLKRERLEKEYKAVKKLLRKSHNRLGKIVAESGQE